MEYKTIINFLGNTPNQPTKFRRKNWVEANDDSHGVCSIGSQIRFKLSMLRSSLCDYSDAYILVNGIITIIKGPENTTDADKQADESTQNINF